LPSVALGVGHAAICATIAMSLRQMPIERPVFSTDFRLRSKNASGVPFAGSATGVGHEEHAVADVRRAEACSWQDGGPDGISIALQVVANSGHPFPAVLARNLLSKDRCRAALGDEAVKSGPEVSFVDMATLLSRDRKRLTGEARGPDGTGSRPAGEGESVRPAADAGEEVALVGVEVGGSNSEH
jgi:hypothetical protein